MKLIHWAKKQGVHYNTAYRWFKLGKIPNAYQLDTGTIIIEEKIDVKELMEVLKRIEKKLDELKWPNK